MEVLSTNGAHVANSDIASRTSITPQQSYVSTPATVLSISQKSNSIRHESGLDTPPSAHNGYEGYQLNNEYMSPLQNEQRNHNKDGHVDPELVEEHLSNYNNDHVDYTQDVDFGTTQEQTGDTAFGSETYYGTEITTQQEAFDDLQQFPHENSYLSLDEQYVPAEVPTTVGKRADTAFAYDLFSLPGSGHGYGLRTYQEGNDYLVQSQQGVYGNMQPTPGSAYGSAYDNVDFNRPSAYPNMFAGHGMHLGTLPSNISPVADGSPARQNGSNRARARNNDDMDSKLLQWRGEGKSYREIRDLGNWGLEESTLRGRYRTLIKSKEQRLRKPNWPDTAISAMFEAVELFVPASATKLNGKEAAAKIPWKKVAEWMRDNRGCYLYGNATVKKKYVEETAKRKQVRRRTMV
ncbi:hypothetical protein LTS08_000278 [Lithohypha guttulata]|uniref:Uncharacterized protein n=1 Tax=Lithohypha guttulata TaxID=1690604 RepID=A0AAN7SXM1_9EURO|nr:hypothetical protein LTR51_007101 [Lithohypha guttulata]KAK5084289.1 hypothetical protein LTR05_005365 [Lithohypha guttulata]KAK5106161.1 hypothetical protein LTS08_000278 [Lithohypha guttulata]